MDIKSGINTLNSESNSGKIQDHVSTPETKVRQSVFGPLRENSSVSVLIIGGGINGIGLFRELALQRIDILLVEKTDYCAGASAAMTRVIHGGLRYLENAEVGLVRESLRERNLLMANAPHYVKPLPTTIPIFSWTSGIITGIRNFVGWSVKPRDRGALLIKVGLSLYDLLAGCKSPLPKHKFRSRRKALSLRPSINPGVICTATYYDARITYPERLGLELVQDAEKSFTGARALNYVSVKGAMGKTVILHDEVSGETCEVKPQIVVNASGAWIDFTNGYLGHESGYIAGTKGSHIVLDHPEVARQTGDDMIYFVNKDGRICIFYTVCGKVIAGATDIPSTDPDAVCDEFEVDYILDSMKQVYPSLQIDRSHVVFRFCGVRPLPASNALVPGQVSRDFSFPVLAPGNGIDFPIYSLVGGKWTTFRALAEHVADAILKDLGQPRICSSRNIPIGGGKNFSSGMSQNKGISQDRMAALIERYGSVAGQVSAYLQKGQDAMLSNHNGYSRREIEYLALNERIVHLDDLILRRTLIGILGELNLALLKELAEIFSSVLGWSKQTEEAEIKRTIELYQKVHKVMLLNL